MTKKPLIYLASPYSDPDPLVRDHRFYEATYATANLLAQGKQVFCPVTYSHAICAAIGMDPLWPGWYDLAETFLRRSDEMIILRLPGWEKSKGVQAELQIASKMEIPVSYMDPV